MKNKIFSLILAFTLIFLLAGCKNEPSQLPETDEPKETEYYLSDGKENACDDAEACETCIQTAESSIIAYEYYGAAEPPVRCGESHLSGLTEPPT